MIISSTSTISQLDLTPQGLFPNEKIPDQDPKCVIVAKVIQELSKGFDMSSMTQFGIQTNAKTRYSYLSQEKRLTLPEADHCAFTLYQKGVSQQTAKAYYSFRLTEADAKKWVIVIV